MSKINYLVEINEFYDWLETNQIPKSAIALWHALMHINNKTRWDATFTVAISTIESKTGFKRSELFEARNILTQKGRMKWKQRGGNLCAEYEIIFFSVRNTDASADAKAYTSADAKAYTNPTQKGTINKLNKKETKQNLSKSHSGDESPVPEKKELPFWKSFIDVWHKSYELKIGEKYLYQSKDFKHLKGIYQFLKKRADVKAYEWTEDNMEKGFEFFINKAWEKDEWSRQNFSPSKLIGQFNEIANGKQSATNNKQQTGAGVSTSSILSKIASMPDKSGDSGQVQS
jgi:hypothetical protein